MGDHEADRDRALPRHEAGTVDAQLPDQQHLAQGYVKRAVRLGGDAVGVELALGVDEHHLLERVDRLENRIEGGVAEGDDLVGASALGAGEALAQCRLAERERLAVLEVVVRLLRPAERGILQGLRPACRRREDREQEEPAAAAGRHGDSGSSA